MKQVSKYYLLALLMGISGCSGGGDSDSSVIPDVDDRIITAINANKVLTNQPESNVELDIAINNANYNSALQRNAIHYEIFTDSSCSEAVSSGPGVVFDIPAFDRINERAITNIYLRVTVDNEDEIDCELIATIDHNDIPPSDLDENSDSFLSLVSQLAPSTLMGNVTNTLSLDTTDLEIPQDADYIILVNNLGQVVLKISSDQIGDNGGSYQEIEVDYDILEPGTSINLSPALKDKYGNISGVESYPIELSRVEVLDFGADLAVFGEVNDTLSIDIPFTSNREVTFKIFDNVSLLKEESTPSQSPTISFNLPTDYSYLERSIIATDEFGEEVYFHITEIDGVRITPFDVDYQVIMMSDVLGSLEVTAERANFIQGAASNHINLINDREQVVSVIVEDTLTENQVLINETIHRPEVLVDTSKLESLSDGFLQTGSISLYLDVNLSGIPYEVVVNGQSSGSGVSDKLQGIFIGEDLEYGVNTVQVKVMGEEYKLFPQEAVEILVADEFFNIALTAESLEKINNGFNSVNGVLEFESDQEFDLSGTGFAVNGSSIELTDIPTEPESVTIFAEMDDLSGQSEVFVFDIYRHELDVNLDQSLIDLSEDAFSGSEIEFIFYSNLEGALYTIEINGDSLGVYTGETSLGVNSEILELSDEVNNIEFTVSVPGAESIIETLTLSKRSWVQISSSSNHTCAIDSTGGLYCWGENEFGQLGTGNNTDMASKPKSYHQMALMLMMSYMLVREYCIRARLITQTHFIVGGIIFTDKWEELRGLKAGDYQ